MIQIDICIHNDKRKQPLKTYTQQPFNVPISLLMFDAVNSLSPSHMGQKFTLKLN